MLEQDASSCESSVDQNSSRSSGYSQKRLQNQDKISSITMDQLHKMENDLDLAEKVSLVFLLCGKEEMVNKRVILQHLCVLTSTDEPQQAHPLSTLLLHRPMQSHWREELIEALLVTRSFRVLRNFGLFVKELRSNYLPFVIDVATYIHPVMKALFMLCEKFTELETSNFIDYLCRESSEMMEFQGNSRYLEMYVLQAICIGLINIGSIDSATGTIDPATIDLKVILDYLKINENVNWHEKLSKLLKKLKCNQISMDKSIGKSNFNELMKAKDVVETQSTHDELVYKVARKNIGYALIINQKVFHRSSDPNYKNLLPKSGLGVRRGTDLDRDKLRKVFESFGYQIVVKEDIEAKSFPKYITRIVDKSINKDSLIVCILSHGRKGVVFGSDSVPVRIEDIEKLMTLPKLADIPKLLILQACQGEETQQVLESNASRLETDGPGDGNFHTDLLRIQSTVDGFTSFRDIDNGSWFIQTFCDYMEKYGDTEHIQKILTRVQYEIKNRKGDNNERMIPQAKTTLSKEFYLPKRS